MESVAGSVMVRSGQDFQCYISHVKLPSLSWRLPNIVAGGRAAGAVGTTGAVCQAQHCQHHTLPSSTGAGQAASCSACWGPMGWQGACGKLLQLVAVTAGGQKGWFASWKGGFHCSRCPLFLLGFAAELEEWDGEGLW